MLNIICVAGAAVMESQCWNITHTELSEIRSVVFLWRTKIKPADIQQLLFFVLIYTQGKLDKISDSQRWTNEYSVLALLYPHGYK